MRRRFVAIVIDGLGPGALSAAIAAGAAPTLALLRARDDSLGASAFPSLTPVCLSSIATGTGPGDHNVPHLQWYHRGESRFVEYGSSFGATIVAGGTRQSIDDSMVNLNALHLSPRTPTMFERVEDAGLVAGSINFYVWRGRVRHEISSRFVRGFARRAGFFDATYGPTRFFFGELFGSDRTGAPRNMGVTGRNDDHAGSVGRWLVARDGFDLLVFYLPETDATSHRVGPQGALDTIAQADRNVARLMSAAGGPEPFLDRYGVVMCADHGQTDVLRDDDPRDGFTDLRAFVKRGRSDPADCDVAIAASNRAAMVYDLRKDLPREELALRLASRASVDVVAWREDEHAVALRDGRRLRFAPGGERHDERGNSWNLDGDVATLALDDDGPLRSPDYPNALERLWSALRCVNAGDVLASAAPGWEFADAAGESHLGGGSHGSLHACDSLVPFTVAALAGDVAPPPALRSITDLAGLAYAHLGIAAPVHPTVAVH